MHIEMHHVRHDLVKNRFDLSEMLFNVPLDAFNCIAVTVGRQLEFNRAFVLPHRRRL